MSNSTRPERLLAGIGEVAAQVKRKPLDAQCNEVMLNMAVYELAAQMKAAFFRCTTRNVDRKIARKLEEYGYASNYGGSYPKISDFALTDAGRSYVQGKFAKELAVEIAWLKWGLAYNEEWQKAATGLEAAARRKFPHAGIIVEAKKVQYSSDFQERQWTITVHETKNRSYFIRPNEHKNYQIGFGASLKVSPENHAQFSKELSKMIELLKLVQQTMVMEPDIQDFLPQNDSEGETDA